MHPLIVFWFRNLKVVITITTKVKSAYTSFYCSLCLFLHSGNRFLAEFLIFYESTQDNIVRFLDLLFCQIALIL